MLRKTVNRLALLLSLSVIAFLLVSLGLAGYDYWRQERANYLRGLIAAVSGKGGTVIQDKSRPDRPVIGIRLLAGQDLTSEWLDELLAVCPQLKSLNLSASNVTDEMLDTVPHSVHLEELYLSSTAISDAGVKRLRGLSQLRELSLDDTKISDAALEEIGQLSELRGLYLSNTLVTDAGLKHLQSLDKLERLSLNETRVTEAGVLELKKVLPNVKVYR